MASPTYFQHGLLLNGLKEKQVLFMMALTQVYFDSNDASITMKFNQISTKLTLKKAIQSSLL